MHLNAGFSVQKPRFNRGNLISVCVRARTGANKNRWKDVIKNSLTPKAEYADLQKKINFLIILAFDKHYTLYDNDIMAITYQNTKNGHGVSFANIKIKLSSNY